MNTQVFSVALAPRFANALGRVPQNARVRQEKGRVFYRVQAGDTLKSIAQRFDRKASEAGNLVRINNIPAGRPLRVGSWIQIPNVWADPGSAARRKRAARTLMGCIDCNKNPKRKDPRTLGASWWESYDSCPAGMIPVIDDVGDIIDCVCGPNQVRDEDFWGNPAGCLTDDSAGGGGGGGSGSGGDDGYRDPSDYLSADFEQYEPGIYAGYYDDRTGTRQRCPTGHAYFEDMFACLPYTPKKGSGSGGGGNTNTGGGGGGTNTGGGSGSGSGSDKTSGSGSEKTFFQKVGDFVKKPAVIGTVAVIGVVGTGVVLSKRAKKRGGGGGAS